jgi:hypothetical protein
MKSNLSFPFTLLLSIFTLQLCAQVYEGDEPMSVGTNNSLTVLVEVSDTKITEEVWKSFMKDYGGKTKKNKGNEWLTTDAEIVAINGVNAMQIYARCKQGADGNVEHTVWFRVGEDDYLASNRKEQYAEAEKMLLKFAHEVKTEKTKRELEDAEKKLKSLNNDFDKLKRQNDGYHKDIEEAEKKIQMAKDNIVKNEEQQSDATQKIDLQTQLIEEIKRRLSELKDTKPTEKKQKED